MNNRIYVFLILFFCFHPCSASGQLESDKGWARCMVIANLSVVGEGVLQEDTHLIVRKITAYVAEKLKENKYIQIVDYKQEQINNDTRRLLTNKMVKTEAAKIAIENAPVPFVVEINMVYHNSRISENKHLDIFLNAFETYAAVLLASAEIYSKKRSFTSISQALTTTVKVDGRPLWDTFFLQLQDQIIELHQEGLKLKVKVEAALNSNVNFNDKVDGKRIVSLLDAYMNKYAINKTYYLLGESRYYLDLEAKFPWTNSSGNLLPPTFWAQNLADYLTSAGYKLSNFSVVGAWINIIVE